MASECGKKWFRCCLRWCCEGCTPLSVRSTTEDSGVLVPSSGTSDPLDREVQDTRHPTFYVPRRHSSYNADTFHPASAPSVGSWDSASSSEDDERPAEHRRPRSATATNAPGDPPLSLKGRSLSLCEEWSRGNSAVGKHILAGIAESDAQDHGESEFWTDAESYGYLKFTTAYKDHDQKLTVYLNGATELPQKGGVSSYGTFVRVVVTSWRKSACTSRTVKDYPNPEYKEELSLLVNRVKAMTTRNCYLRLSVFDSDRQGRYDAIGHVILSMAKVAAQVTTQVYALPINPMSLPVRNIGQVLMGLAYSANRNRLCIHVIRGRHLRLDTDTNKRGFKAINKDNLDTFLKVTLMCGGQKVKTVRSRVVSESSDPAYNFKNNFIIPPQFLSESSVIVTVVARAILGRTLALGRTVSGPYTATHNGNLTHWGRMAQDSHSIARWRNLYL